MSSRTTLALAATDSATMVSRGLRLSIRNVESLSISIVLPVVLMLVFVVLFGGAIDTGTDYVNYVVPGVILLCAGFASSLTAVSVTQDMTTGVIDRFRSMPIVASAVLTGHVVASVARNLVSTTLVILVALVIGFRPNATPVEWIAVLGVLLTYITAISWLSAAAGLLARTPEGASGFTFALMFLPYASSAFVPVETLPSWLHGFAQYQPVTPTIETVRGLLMGTPIGDAAWWALAWNVGIALASITLALTLFHRRTSSP